MSRKPIPLAVLVLLFSVLCAGDVIKLKNGNRIVCENVREKGDKIEYEIGESTYGVSKSSVESIEKADGLNGHRAQCTQTPPKSKPEPQHTTIQVPLKTEFLCKQLGYKRSSPGVSPPLWMHRCGQIFEGGSPNPKVLEEVEDECNYELSAAAYFTAGNFDHSARNEDGAAAYLKIAMEYNSDNAEILMLYVDVLTNLGRYGESVAVAERLANRIGPDALVILGRAYYLAGMKEQAMQAWRLFCASRGGYGSVEGYAAQAEAILRSRDAQNLRPGGGYYYGYHRPVIK